MTRNYVVQGVGTVFDSEGDNDEGIEYVFFLTIPAESAEDAEEIAGSILESSNIEFTDDTRTE